MATLKTTIALIKALEQESETIDNLTSKTVKLIELEKERQKLQQMSAEELYKEIAQQEELIEKIEEEIEQTDKLNVAKLVTLDKEAKTAKEKIAQNKEITGEFEKQLAILQQHAEEQERLAGIQNRIQEDVKGFLGRLGIKKETYTNSIWGHLEENRKAGATFSQIFSEHGKALKDNLTLSNIWGGAWEEMWSRTIQLTKELDSTLANFNKETGAGGKYDALIQDIGTSHRSLGIDLHESAESIKALKTEMLAFTTLNKNEQANLALATATFQEMGVNAQSTAKGFDALISGLGMTATQAIKAQKEIMATAKELGVSFEHMGSDFAQFAGELTSYGSQATTVFRELATQAKALKMGMSDLLSVADQFDTFEDSANMVGKLNAMMGDATFFSTQMLNATAPERMKLLSQGFKDMGMTFEAMNRQERLSYTELLFHSKDTSKLQKLLAGDLNNTAKAARVAGLSEEELAKASAKVQTIGDRLNQMMTAFGAALAPVVDLLEGAITWLLKLDELMGGAFFKTLGIVIGGYTLLRTAIFVKNEAQKVGIVLSGAAAAAKKTLGIETKALAGAEMGEAAAKKSLTAASGPATEAIKSQGAAAKATNFNILLLGAGILLMGAGLAIAALGFAKLAEAMKGMTMNEISGLITIIALMIGAVFALAGAATFATGPILILGVAFLLLGGGFALMGWGISMMAKAAPVMLTFAAAMIGIGAGALMAALALPVLAFSMVMMAGALALISTADLMALGYMFNALSTFSSGSTSSITGLANAIEKISDAMESIPSGKTILFTTAMETISAMPEIGGGTVTNTTALVDQAIRYRVSQEQSKASGLETLTDLFRATTSPSGEGTSAAPITSQPINIQLSEHTLAKFVVEVVNNKVRIR